MWSTIQKNLELAKVKSTGQDSASGPYGFECLIDLHSCDESTFNRKSIGKFLSGLCKVIDMKRCKVHFWDDVGVAPDERQTEPHTKGTSAVCFMLTSTIVVHTLDLLGAVYVNIFSCKRFDPMVAERFTREWFKGETVKSTFMERV